MYYVTIRCQGVPLNRENGIFGVKSNDGLCDTWDYRVVILQNNHDETYRVAVDMMRADGYNNLRRVQMSWGEVDRVMLDVKDIRDMEFGDLYHAETWAGEVINCCRAECELYDERQAEIASRPSPGRWNETPQNAGVNIDYDANR